MVSPLPVFIRRYISDYELEKVVTQMKYEESKYIGFDGTRMFMAVYRPDNDKPRALLILLHGMGSHAGDFSEMGGYLADKEIAVFVPDLRGFGHYSGLKGHVMSFDEYTEDIQNLVMQVKDRYLNKITYLLGSSMGGINAIGYVIRYPRTIDGLLLQCPGVSHRVNLGYGTRFIVKLLSILNVKRYFSLEPDYKETSRNPETIKRHESDPLRFERVTPRFISEMLSASNNAFLSAPRIMLPVLIQQAGNDNAVIPEKNKVFFDNIAAPDKTWKLYEGLYHEIHEEPEREMVLSDLCEWLDTRLPS
ncbi:MAG: alpha/beta hydrolase [Promethearchaeota archaeon]